MDMKYVSTFREHIDESVSGIRNRKTKIDLSKERYAYHWINEGNLFDQCYDFSGDTREFILRKQNGKSLTMPPLPPEQFVLGSNVEDGFTGVCMTVDPGYYQAGFTGESNICIVFPLDSLRKMKFQDLTDNGEAEIRFSEIKGWDKLAEKIFIVKKVYEKGDGWEGFYYRAVKEWLPESLKTKVEVLPSARAISKELAEKYS